MALNYRENRRGTSMKRRLSTGRGSTVASAGTLTLGTGGNVFTVTGTTTINYITTTGWPAGSRITLVTSAAAVFAHNTGTVPTSTAALQNNSGANITSAANKAVSYVFDGTNWIQD